MLILVVFFFVIPSAFRSARLGLSNKENDVKDWLPSDFPETAELEWFADDFAGESFVLATWPGCTTDDQRLRLLEQKVLHECDTYDPSRDMSARDAEYYVQAKETGQELQLLSAGRELDNWGGKQEKWFSTPQGRWYFITPEGKLYRWEEKENGPSSATRFFKRQSGSYELTGTFIAAFGDQTETTETNPFYNDPSLVCAPLFHTVETGASVADRLARKDGPLWPIGMIDPKRKPVLARRLAMQRLSGALFAPAVSQEFDWTPLAFRDSIAEKRRETLPVDFEAQVKLAVDQIVEDRFDGDLVALQNATSEQQAEVWYEVFDSVEVEPPPRQTCLLITLTDLAKDNLAHAIGRGVLGGPRGRFLQLAADSGIYAPQPPSMAPPPFDADDIESVAGMPPLRMGGPPVDNIAIDEEGTITLVRLVGYSILVGVILSYLCFASIKITIMVFIVGGSAAMLSMAVVGWTGGRVDAVLMSMPSLVYVLGLSGAIHVINYFRDEVRQAGYSGAAGRALRHAAVPCSLAALTTAIGLISLYSSNLAPISNFGLYAAIGVVGTLAILFTYLPASLHTFISEPVLNLASGGQSPDSAADQGSATVDGAAAIDVGASVAALKSRPEEQESALSRGWAAVGRWITGHHAIVCTACLTVLIVGSFGLFKIQTSVQLLKLFDPDARIIRDYAWLEDNFGKLVPMELVLRVPPSMQAQVPVVGTETQSTDSQKKDLDATETARRLNVLERVEATSRINQVVRNTLGEMGLGIVGQAVSADNFLPPLPEVSNSYQIVRAKYERDLLSGRQDLLESDYLRIEDSGPYKGSELWRISLRVDALSDVDYGGFISTLRTSVEPILRAYDVRQELLYQLTANGEGPAKPLSGNQRILVVGRTKPRRLADQSFVLVDDQAEGDPRNLAVGHSERIDTEAIFLSTLSELLDAEKLPRVAWIDPSQMETPIDLGGEKWQRLIKSRDCVIWIGDDSEIRESLASAPNLVDARSVFDKEVKAELVDDRIPSISGSGGPGSTGLQVVYTGVVPVVYKAQRTLLASLVRSIGMAFVLIAFVMVMLLNPSRTFVRGMAPNNMGNAVMAGAVSMIPNVFPVLLIFGIMGHWGRKVDIGTMMTASVAMGVAVDDTIHFLSWFRAYLDKGLNRIEAIVMTYRRVGPAMTQTTIVGGLGLFVFSLSTFTPTQRFGSLMLVLLAAALVGDLVLLPALLAGPLGRFFKPRTDGDESRSEPPVAAASNSSVAEPDRKQTTSEDESVVPVDKETMPQLRVHYPHPKSESDRTLKGR